MAARLPTPQEIDHHVRGILAEAPGVGAVTRTVAHFARLAPSVDVWIEVDPSHSLNDCHGIGASAQGLVLDSGLNFDAVKIHLDISKTEPA